MEPPHGLSVDLAETFDRRSGSLLERGLFNHRQVVILLCLLVTAVLGFQATRLKLQASFEQMIPTGHPYIVNYLAHKADLKGSGNVLRVAVENPRGDIIDAAYIETLRKINDELYLVPGLDRLFVKSLWTPATRWIGVTEDGFEGGPVIPDGYDGSAQSLGRLRANIDRSGEVGRLVSADFRSSLIEAPLLDAYPDGRPIDYKALSDELERIRAKYQAQGVLIHITGFAKIVGDLIDGLRVVMMFFAGAIGIATLVLLAYTRCIRSTLLVICCSQVAVLWLLGMLPTLGFALNPYSILVPFLVFAIGVSHGAQKMNGIMQDVGRGIPKLIAARLTFRRLFLAGLTALLADAVGFAALMVIKIEVIRDLAVTASIGVFVLIFTNLVLLPILLSYVGVSRAAAARSIRAETAGLEARRRGGDAVWTWLGRFTRRPAAIAAIAASLLLATAGLALRSHLQVGDLDPGAPELRADSRYNRDNAYLAAHYAASSDVLIAMVTTPSFKCIDYSTLDKVDGLEWSLAQVPGVISTVSYADTVRQGMAGYNEGNFKWYDLRPNQDAINEITTNATRDLFNVNCDLLSLYVYLKDHRADTLTRAVDFIEAFSRDNSTPDMHILLGAGNAGIEAATNVVVKAATHEMLFLVYGAVIILCFITFRSARAVLCAVLPLMLTSLLCEALMVLLNIGVKVATLPVIALGVGIGVDYSLYILSVTLTGLRSGQSLAEAYQRALRFTGRVVVLTGVTLSIGVATWAFSPIKFQADMGVLLAFMFLWNMVGAMVLLPSLARFLLVSKVLDPARLPSHAQGPS